MHNYLTGSDEHPASWYAASLETPPPEQPTLKGAHRADVCVIGGGYTGLSAALTLAEQGYSVIVLEGRRIGWGASGRNGGQIVRGFSMEPDDIADAMGDEDMRRLWAMSEEALGLIRARIETYGIECDYTPGYVYTALKSRHLREIEDMTATAEALGVRGYEPLDREALQREVCSPLYLGGLYDAGSGHLHPLKFTLGLARAAEERGAKLYEHSLVTAIEPMFSGVRVTTADGEVAANFAIVAGNGHLSGLLPQVEGYVLPAGTLMVATEPMSQSQAQAIIPRNAAVADLNTVLSYFRLSADNRLLFGGPLSYSGVDYGNPAKTAAARIGAIFPSLKPVQIAYEWGGVIGLTLNRMPHLSRIGPHIIAAQGYSGHGLALSQIAGKVAAEATIGIAERFDVFARIPHDPFPGGRLFRTPGLVLGMLWYRLRDML